MGKVGSLDQVRRLKMMGAQMAIMNKMLTKDMGFKRIQ